MILKTLKREYRNTKNNFIWKFKGNENIPRKKINLLQVIQNEIGNWESPTHFWWVRSAVKIFSQDRRNLVVWKSIFRMINDIHGLVKYMSHLFERQLSNVTNQKQNFSFFLSTPLSSVQSLRHVQLFATPWTVGPHIYLGHKASPLLSLFFSHICMLLSISIKLCLNHIYIIFIEWTSMNTPFLPSTPHSEHYCTSHSTCRACPT